MSKKKEIGKLILFISIPLLLQFLGQANLTSNMLSSIKMPASDILIFKDICCFLGIAFTFIPLSFAYGKHIHSNYHLKKEQAFLIQKIKEYFVISKFFGRRITKGTDINIRIFTLKNPKIHTIIKKIFKYEMKQYVIMKNVEGFTDNNILSGLAFEVYPHQQGLVGMCYKKNMMTYDFDLKKPLVDYHLTDYQKDQTQDTISCICVPIHNSKSEICAIVSFDSAKKIVATDDQKKALFPALHKFSRELFDNVNTLFK
jgi:hypothetical protein